MIARRLKAARQRIRIRLPNAAFFVRQRQVCSADDVLLCSLTVNADVFSPLDHPDNLKIALPFAEAPAGTYRVTAIVFGAGVNTSQVLLGSDSVPQNNYLGDLAGAIYAQPPATVTLGISSIFAAWTPFAGQATEYYTVDIGSGAYTALPPASGGTAVPTQRVDVVDQGLRTNADTFTLVLYDTYFDGDFARQCAYSGLEVSVYGRCVG